MTQEQTNKINEILQDFPTWLRNHVDPLHDDKTDDLVPPKAFDILLGAEDRYFEALEKLEEKHRTLTTVAEIDNFTKDILKLCK